MAQEIVCGIYKITSPNGKIYIGQALNIYGRWGFHKSSFLKRKSKLNSSFIAHGLENHLFEIVEICLESELNNKEKYYIKFYDTFETEHGLNLTDGGNSCRLSEETKNKIKERHKEGKCGMHGKKHSEETKVKMSNSATGEKNHRFGTKASEDTRLKMSKSQTGKRIGFTHTEEAREKIRIARAKQVSPMKGKTLSEEHKRKIVETRRRNNSYGLSKESIEKREKTRRENEEMIRQERLTMIF